MNKPLLFLDFDETLFNRYAYINWADQYLKKYGVATGGYSRTVDSFHTHMGEKLRLYRHDEHILSASGRTWSFISGELERELILNDHDFCYSDTHDFLRHVMSLGNDVRILTYGNGEYQYYKMKTCKHLGQLRIPVHVVNQPKRLFLAENFPLQQGVLLDDKYPLDLKQPWSHIWINRKGGVKKPKVHSTSTVEISGLDQFGAAMELLKHQKLMRF